MLLGRKGGAFERQTPFFRDGVINAYLSLGKTDAEPLENAWKLTMGAVFLTAGVGGSRSPLNVGYFVG